MIYIPREVGNDLYLPMASTANDLTVTSVRRHFVKPSWG
jgi:hypothetical protein